jgi:hypothetical protein
MDILGISWVLFGESLFIWCMFGLIWLYSELAPTERFERLVLGAWPIDMKLHVAVIVRMHIRDIASILFPSVRFFENSNNCSSSFPFHE